MNGKAVLLIIIGLIIAIILIFVSGAFDISEIIVEGNSYISDEQIISFSGIELNTNIFSVYPFHLTFIIK